MQSNSSWPAVSHSISLMSSPFKLTTIIQQLLFSGVQTGTGQHSRDVCQSDYHLQQESNTQLPTHHIRFSRKSTPMVFLYSAVKIPLQYFWIIEDLPTAPLPTMTTWRELSQFIEIKHKTLRINLYLREPWLWKVLNITTTHMNSFICLNMLNTSKALWTQPSLIMAYNLVKSLVLNKIWPFSAMIKLYKGNNDKNCLPDWGLRRRRRRCQCEK